MQRAASRGGGRFVANALPFLAFMVGGSYGVSVLLQVGPRATRTIRPRHTPPPPPLLPSRTGARLASSVSSAHPDARASLAAPRAHPPRLFSGTERRARRQGGRGRHARAVADADRATAQSRLRPRGGEGEDRGRARRGGGGGDEDGPRASALGGAEGEARARVGGDQAVVRGRGGRVGCPERTRMSSSHQRRSRRRRASRSASTHQQFARPASLVALTQRVFSLVVNIRPGARPSFGWTRPWSRPLWRRWRATTRPRAPPTGGPTARRRRRPPRARLARVRPPARRAGGAPRR